LQYTHRSYAPPQAPEPEEPPPKIRAAITFVGMTNNHISPIEYGKGTRGPLESEEYTSDFHYPDFHPDLERAYRKACTLLGEYFDSK
jgi:hypothetical protein